MSDITKRFLACITAVLTLICIGAALIAAITRHIDMCILSLNTLTTVYLTDTCIFLTLLHKDHHQ